MWSILRGVGKGISYLAKVSAQSKREKLTKNLYNMPQIVEKSKAMNCDRCQVNYDPNDLEKVLLHTSETCERCEVCGIGYDGSNWSQVQKHASEIRCSKCGEIYSDMNNEEFRRHAREKICNICDEIYDSAAEPNHELEKHPNLRYCAGCQLVVGKEIFDKHENHVKCAGCNEIYDSKQEEIENLHSACIEGMESDSELNWQEIQDGKQSKLIPLEEITTQNSKMPAVVTAEKSDSNEEKKEYSLETKFSLDSLPEIDYDNLWKQISEVFAEEHCDQKATIKNGTIVRTTPTTTAYNPASLSVYGAGEYYSIRIRVIIRSKIHPERKISIPKKMIVRGLKYRMIKELELPIGWRVEAVFAGQRLKEDQILHDRVKEDQLLNLAVMPPRKSENTVA